MATTGWSPVAAGMERLLAQLRDLTAKHYTVAVCAENATSALGISQSLRDEGFNAAVVDELGSGVQVVAAPVERASYARPWRWPSWPRAT